jgi:hypothetical protein
MKMWCSLGLLMALPSTVGGQQPAPIIDVHLHALAANSQGPPPLALCLPTTTFPAAGSGSSWGLQMLSMYRDPPCPDPVWSADTDEELMEATLAVMERRNVIGVTSGPRLPMWQARAGERIIPGSVVLFNGGPGSASVDSLRARFADGRIRVFGEVTIQYRGMEPGDPAFETYLALAEETDVPVGIHMGPGPPGAPYLGSPNYRARLHSPLLLEDASVRHPDLRLYVMHAGWPMLDDLLALLWAHPQVYVGVGVISFALPRAEFHRYLRTIVDAGFGERVMVGSDQMVWPEALEFAIRSIETADFLTGGQKRDILYDKCGSLPATERPGDRGTPRPLAGPPQNVAMGFSGEPIPISIRSGAAVKRNS